MPGNLCLIRTKIVSARSSNRSRFSRLTEELDQGDLLSLLCIFLFQITIDASILSFKSRILCSVDRSSPARNCSGLKNSTVILLYIASPRLSLPFFIRYIIKPNNN